MREVRFEPTDCMSRVHGARVRRRGCKLRARFSVSALPVRAAIISFLADGGESFVTRRRSVV
jgi:hypothetical protein